MGFQPKTGDVIRYDYLWADQEKQGLEAGVKDRPCAVVIAMPFRQDQMRNVFVCAITHSRPEEGQSAIELTPKLSRHLGLDGERAWIKTHEVNVLEWGQNPPHGVTMTPKQEWTYGQLPQAITKQAQEQLQRSIRDRRLRRVQRREEDVARYRSARPRQNDRDTDRER